IEGLGGVVEFFLGLVSAQATLDLGLLVVDRGADRRQAGWMGARMLDDILAERVMFLVACRFDRLGGFETHVLPAEILEAVVGLAEPLRAHGRAGGTLASEETGGERGERLCFASHLRTPY